MKKEKMLLIIVLFIFCCFGLYNLLHKEYDYIGVPYPEGNMGQDYQYLFNHDDVEAVYFRGFEDIERQEFIYNLTEFYKNKE